jgi:4-hydroxy-tetrahydrodipicolinate reductase
MYNYKMKIILIGAEGKFGKAILSSEISFQITKIGSPRSSLPSDITPFLDAHDLVLDVSSNDAFFKNFKKVVLAKKPIVIGITALSQENLDLIKEASKTIPIFLSSNFSSGIALLKKIIKILPKGSYKLTEIHHSLKKDSPSGTALDLANILPSHPNILSIREGSIIGSHSILLTLPHETLEIKHEAINRLCFADGAHLACTFLSNKPAGLYTSIYD